MNSPELATEDSQVWVRNAKGRMVPLEHHAEPDEPEVEHITAQVAYRWDCPSCMYVNYLENDPSMETCECEDCDVVVYVTGIR